jgi:hypothetical protein
MGEELSRPLAAGFIKEVQHPDWINNPEFVLKKSGKWRMCVDYKSLNKAWPEDAFPLPRIDQVLDLNTWCELLSFLDAHLANTRYPSLTWTSLPPRSSLLSDVFFCVKMPLGLKNAGATYQQCM